MIASQPTTGPDRALRDSVTGDATVRPVEGAAGEGAAGEGAAGEGVEGEGAEGEGAEGEGATGPVGRAFSAGSERAMRRVGSTGSGVVGPFLKKPR